MNRFKAIYCPISIKRNKIKSQIEFLVLHGGNIKEIKKLQKKLNEVDSDG